jgi:hypothetical protein
MTTLNKSHRYSVDDVYSCEQFLNRYYKKSRIFADLENYRQIILNRMASDLEKYGHTWISRHESVTGQPVIYFK